MSEETNHRELSERLDLIESMIAEGRRTTGFWGVTFVVWGVAFYVAFGWYLLGGHTPWAWPVTMVGTYVVTRVLHHRRRAGQPKTALGRAIGSIWTAMIVSMFVLFPAIGFSGSAVAPSILTAVLATMLGTTNAACGMLLKWKQQFACALIWWASAIVSCFGTPTLGVIGFMTASFFCWIVFGIYAMVSESRTQRRQEAANA